MPRVIYRDQTYDLPAVVDGQNLRHHLQLAPNEIPVRITDTGEYVPIKDYDQYRVHDEDRFDKVNRLING
jgi:hypothetical protein